MPLQKQNLNIPFAQGLDLKTDPKQIPIGKFLSLKNVNFDEPKLFKKRNGFPQITTVPEEVDSITTFSGGLVGLGDSLWSFSEETMDWLNKGNIKPVSFNQVELQRSSSSQQSVDVAVTEEGLTLTAWQDSDGKCYYKIIDAGNVSTVVNQTQLPTGAASPRTFILGNYYIVTYLVDITATTHLQYIAIPIVSPTSPGSATDISATVDSINAAYDGKVINNQLFVAWDASDVGGAVRLSKLSSTLVGSTTVTFAGRSAQKIMVTGDLTVPNPVVWLAWREASGDCYTAARSTTFGAILAPTQFLTAIDVVNLTGCARNNVLTVFYEISNTYSYSSVRTDYLNKITITSAGAVGVATTIIRSLGLASKAFEYEDMCYFLAVYGGTYQPTYFLIDENGNVISKFAYSNGQTYGQNQILSSISLYNATVYFGYLFKAQIIAVNKSQNVDSVGGTFGLSGINLGSITFGFQMQALEIAGALHMNGGFLRMYDGVKPVEHSFFVWPEDLGATPIVMGGGMSSQKYFYQATYEWTDARGNIHRSAPSIPFEVDLTDESGTAVTFTSEFALGDTSITVSSVSGLHVGQEITDTTTGANLTPGTVITAINGLVLTLNQPTAGASAGAPGDTLQTVDTLGVALEIPTLRVTAKIGLNPVRIVVYRWSEDQQNYYQVTSVTSPVLNKTDSDSVLVDDYLSDAEILGNALIYTTGGVIENIAAPASSYMTLYKSRLFLIDAEDKNLEWYSKQVIENTPVELSDLLTQYIAPTIGAVASTGNLESLFAMDDKIISFKKDAIYYETGNGPDNTGANNDFSEPNFITATVGCANQASIVFIPSGLIFKSDKGFWLLGRDLSTRYIGADVEDFNQYECTSAYTIPGTNQVRFTLSNGAVLMYDYYMSQWCEFEGVNAISSCIYQDEHTLIDKFGRVFQESPEHYIDGSVPTLMSMTTGWLNLAGVQGFERAYYFYLLGQFQTPHKVVIEIAYDYDPTIVQQSIITPDNFSGYYGDDSLYGGSSPYGGISDVEQYRVFLEKQKCQAFQVTIREIYDGTYGVPAGAGLTLSGLNLVVGTKKGYPTLPAKYSVG